MEPQENVYCCYENYNKNKCNVKKNCLKIVAVILLSAFTFVIGLIIGAALSSAILSALAAIIVLAVILGLLLLLTFILMLCNRKKENKCNCCCSK